MITIRKVLNDLGDDAIFKYVPFDSQSLQILIDKKLYFSPPHFQDDPLDSNFQIDARYYNSFPNDPLLNSEGINRIALKYHIKKLLNNYGICCFSKDIKNILLWSNHANGGRGFCFIFSKSKLLASLQEKNETMVVDNVKYNDVVTIEPEKINKEIVFDEKAIIFNKLPCWKYEAEVRFMCKIITTPLSQERFFPFNLNSLHAIVLGQRIESDNMVTIRNILKMPEYENLNLFMTGRSEVKPQSIEFLNLTNRKK